jgi:head-tail adaptor
MHAGELDRRITIQKPGTVDDPEYGPQPGGWIDVYVRVPARVFDQLPSNSESIQGGLRLADRPAQVRTRYLKRITSDMRVIVHAKDSAAGEQDVAYEISGGPAEIGRREWTEFTIRNFSS